MIGIQNSLWHPALFPAPGGGPFNGHGSLANSLVSYWPLSELSGTREDIVGTNDLTDNNTVLYQNLGPQGVVADYQNDNESLSHADPENFFPADDQSWMLSFWINVPTWTGSDYMAQANFGTTGFYLLQTGTTTISFGVGDGSAFSSLDATGMGAGWRLITVWWDSADQKSRIQIDNGTPATLSGTVAYDQPDPGSVFRLGSAVNGFVGRMSNAGLWGRVLTSDERTSLYNNGLGKTYATLSTDEKVSLISYWALTEASGNRADSHGSNTLIDNNTVTSVDNTHPGFGKAASFVATNNESLSIVDNATTVWGESGDGVTVSFWIKPGAATAFPLVFGRDSGTQSNRTFEIVGANGSWASLFMAFYPAGGPWVQTNAATPLTVGAWNLLICWIDPADSKQRVSVNDGAAVASAAGSSATLGTTASSFIIGGSLDGFVADSNAEIAHVGIWNRPLTAQERTDLYNAGAGRFY